MMIQITVDFFSISKRCYIFFNPSGNLVLGQSLKKCLDVTNTGREKHKKDDQPGDFLPMRSLVRFKLLASSLHSWLLLTGVTRAHLPPDSNWKSPGVHVPF